MSDLLRKPGQVYARRGAKRLYRPPPSDFDAEFVRIGWTDVEAHFSVGAKTVKKWLDYRNADRSARGLLRLQEARAAYIRMCGRAVALNSVRALSRKRRANPDQFI